MATAASHTSPALFAPVPMKWVGPLKLSGAAEGMQDVPLATFETTLWPSVNRGAKVSTLTEQGIVTTVVDERMARSVLFEAPDAASAVAAMRDINGRRDELQHVVSTASHYARLLDIHHQVVGNLLFTRFEFTTGDASGHNMVTLASDRLMDHLLREIPALRYGSVSGNYCSDKKATAVNGILGRGKNVVAELLIPDAVVRRRLHTTPQALVDLNVRKNLVGTTVAGGLRSANAHYANMLLAFYLATGQDAANIVEGSQGITHAELRGDDLYFSCTLPSIVVGTVGNGKDLPFVTENLTRLGCTEPREVGGNARRLAAVCAATVLCGELSLMAALTNPGELMAAHLTFERKKTR